MLTDNKDGMTFNEIAEALDASVRTIHDDIELISEFSFFFNVEIKGQNIKLHYIMNQSIQKVYAYLLTTSSGYKIISEILTHGVVSLEHLQNRLDLSRSTIYRLSVKISHALKTHFNIELAQNPFTLVGEEVDIRYFLTHFIAEKYTNVPTHLVPEVDFFAFDSMMKTICDEYNYDLDYASLVVIRTLTIINIIRTKQGYIDHNLDINVEMTQIIMSPESSIHDDLVLFMQHLGLPYEMLYFSNIFTGLIISNSIYNEQALIKMLENDPILRSKINSIDDKLTELATTFELTIPHKWELIYYLYQTVNFYKFEVRSSYILYDTKGIFVDSIRKQYPSFVELGFKLMKEYLDAVLVDYKSEFVNHLFYTVFTHWRNLPIQLFEKNQRIKTVVFSSFDISHAYMLKEHLAWQLGNVVDVEVYTGFIEDTKDLIEKLERSDYSIIIANASLPDIKGKQTISIHSVPTEEDINDILKVVKKFQHKQQKI